MLNDPHVFFLILFLKFSISQAFYSSKQTKQTNKQKMLLVRFRAEMSQHIVYSIDLDLYTYSCTDLDLYRLMYILRLVQICINLNLYRLM